MSDRNKVKTSSTDSSEEIHIGRLIGILIDNRWLLFACTALFAVIGILYALFSTPEYRADALIQVEQNSGSSLIKDLSQMLPNSQPESATEIEIIRSRMILSKTVEELNLDTVIEQSFLPIIGKAYSKVINKDKPRIAISRFSVPDAWLDEVLEIKIVNDAEFSVSNSSGVIGHGRVGQLLNVDGVVLLISDIKAENGTVFNVYKQSTLDSINNILNNLSVNDKGKDTGVLSLSLTGEDPILIKDILNNITRNYLQQNVERKSEEAGKSLDFLKEQLPEVRQALDNAEDKLNQFRQKNDSVDLTLEAKSVLDTMVSVETQLNELTFKEAEISKLYTKEHPSYRSLLEKRLTLEQEKEKLNKRIGSMPKTQQEILRLTRDVQSGQEIYMQLLNKQQELNISKASTVGNVRIIDKAITQPKPVQPKKALVIIIATIFGAILSTGYVLLRSYFYRGIESPEQLEEVGINVYASIPLSEWQQKKDHEFLLKKKSKKQNTRTNQLLAVGNPADLAVEAIRSLRTSLHFAMLEAKNNILMISGASPAIGKTFVNINLAAVIAQSNQRVLIIDGDMRKGYAHDLLGVSVDGGLSDILSAQIDVSNAIKKTSLENLDFISRGRVPPNPSELLMSSRLDSLLSWANENYDMVIIDTPPILAVTDAAIISRHAGTSLLVARFEVNSVKEVEVSIRRFEQNRAEIKGVILNAVVRKALNQYGYGYYQYNYTSENQ